MNNRQGYAAATDKSASPRRRVAAVRKRKPEASAS